MTSARFAVIALDLRERIALGEFAATGAMDSEAELCTRYAVSRPTVRRALDRLRAEGLVESRHGAGWFVTGTAYRQRLALGTFRHAASAVSESGGVIRREVLEFGFRTAPESMRAIFGLDEPGAVLHARSVRRVDGEGLDVVREWVPERFAGALSRDAATDPGIWQTLGRAGHRVASVHQTITAGLASRGDAGLLGTTSGAPLLLIRRLARDAHGIPLALADHRYAAHRFALDVEFHSGPSAAAPEPPGLRAVTDPPQEHAS
ncbi:MAG: GntR family transcriptional regulator [Dermatophilaceae bacterium]